MKVLIYSRVSTTKQDTDRQINELKELCIKKEWEIVDIISEEISGKIKWSERKLAEVLEAKNLDGVVVSELTRLGRSTKDVLDVIDKFKEKNIWLYSYKDNVSTKNKDDISNQLLIAILTSISEFERRTIVSRSVSGLENAIKKGHWTGGKFMPLGYKRVEKKLVIDEEESEIVKDIFNLYLSGLGTKRIARELNKRKIPTRYNKDLNKTIKINGRVREASSFKWSDGTIYSILTNKTYIGEKRIRRKKNKKDEENTLANLKLYSPPIIDADTFQKVQFKLQNTQKRVPKKYFHLLERLIVCGCCERGYFAHKRANNKDNTYKCLSKRYSETCDNYGIGIPKLNNGVWTALKENEEEITNIIQIFQSKNTLNAELNSLTDAIEDLKSQILSFKKKEEKAVELLLEGEINEEIVRRNLKEIKSSITNLELSLKNCELEKLSKEKLIEKQRQAVTSLRSIKDDKRNLKTAINRVVQRIIINPVFIHNLQELFNNKQDKLVFVELFTFINQTKPLCFVVSQRSNRIVFGSEHLNYNRENYDLKLNDINEGGEEEAADIFYRDLIVLKSLL